MSEVPFSPLRSPPHQGRSHSPKQTAGWPFKSLILSWKGAAGQQRKRWTAPTAAPASATLLASFFVKRQPQKGGSWFLLEESLLLLTLSRLHYWHPDLRGGGCLATHPLLTRAWDFKQIPEPLSHNFSMYPHYEDKTEDPCGAQHSAWRTVGPQLMLGLPVRS